MCQSLQEQAARAQSIVVAYSTIIALGRYSLGSYVGDAQAQLPKGGTCNTAVADFRQYEGRADRLLVLRLTRATKVDVEAASRLGL
jgi:hypothetical protein